MAALCIKMIQFHRYLAVLLLLLLSGGNSVSSIPIEDLNSMLAVVRASGYSLFANAITTTDLSVELLSSPNNASFTFFAATDASLFALAMTQSAASYTATLHYHALPRRLSISDLRRFRSRTTLPTLLPSQYIILTRRRRGAISVNGVNVVLPGLYNSRHISIHGLRAILTLRFDQIPTFAAPVSNRVSITPAFAPAPRMDTEHSFSGNTVEKVKSLSPAFPPEISPSSTPSIYPPQTEISPSAPAPKMDAVESFSGNTVENYEPLEWTTLDFSNATPKIDIEDSHPHVVKRLEV